MHSDVDAFCRWLGVIIFWVANTGMFVMAMLIDPDRWVPSEQRIMIPTTRFMSPLAILCFYNLTWSQIEPVSWTLQSKPNAHAQFADGIGRGRGLEGVDDQDFNDIVVGLRHFIAPIVPWCYVLLSIFLFLSFFLPNSIQAGFCDAVAISFRDSFRRQE